MIVKTSRFGDMEVPEEALITFPEGVIGFKDDTRFVMFECSDDGIFKWLQSCDRPELAFVICESGFIMPDFQVAIGEKERQLLQLADPGHAVICFILVIPKNPLDATANLLGPLLMNTETRLGMQLVLINPEYSTRHRIFAGSGNDAPRAGGIEEGEHAGS